MHGNVIKLIIITLIVFLNFSCDKSIFEPDIDTEEQENTIGSFTFDNINVSKFGIQLSWTVAKNAIRYDVLVNDTLAYGATSDNNYQIFGLKPNTDYKITVRAVSQNLKVRNISETIKTSIENNIETYNLIIDKYTFIQYYFTKCMRTPDGGYVYLGDADKYFKGYKTLVKTDQNNRLMWHYDIPTGKSFTMSFEHDQDMALCKDGGYLIFLKNQVLKIDANGLLVWSNTEVSTQLTSVISSGMEMSDGDCLVVGTTTLTRSLYFLCKIASDGKIVWKKNYGKTYINNGLKAANDGKGVNFVLGEAESFGEANVTGQYTNVSLLRFTNNGQLLNELFFIRDYYTTGKSIFTTPDGGMYLVGNIFNASGFDRIYVLRLDNSGKIIWEFMGFSNEAAYGGVNVVNLTKSNSLIIVSYFSRGYVYILQEIDAAGKVEKVVNLGNPGNPIYIEKEDSKYIYVNRYGTIVKIPF